MKGISSFYNVINLCISNKGNLVTIPQNASLLAIGALRIIKKKGLVSFFQKEPSLGSFSFKIFPQVKVQLISTSSRKVYVRGSTLLAQLKSSDQSILYILSTSKGLLTGEEACRAGVGGLILCSARLYLFIRIFLVLSFYFAVHALSILFVVIFLFSHIDASYSS